MHLLTFQVSTDQSNPRCLALLIKFDVIDVEETRILLAFHIRSRL